MVLDTGSMAFMMMSSALVLFMTPGVAFFYGGMVSEGGVVTMMMQSFVAMGIISLFWWFIGFSLCFGTSGEVIGNPGTYIVLHNVGVKDNLTINGIFIDNISGFVFCMFQLTFAIITPTLMTGGWVERMRFKPYVIFLVLWSALVYCPFAHLSWGGGLFFKWGIWDFAGGTVVHITAGWSALASVLVLGKRESSDDKPHNVPFILLGTAMLWFGWFGFNGGSALAANASASAAYINSQLAAAAALWTWILVDWIFKGKPSLVGACVGAIAGLVVVTPCAGYCQPWAAVVMGAIVTVFCQGTIEFRRKYLMRWLDDTLDVFGCHGVGGTVGCILVGVLSDPPECAPGLDADTGLPLDAPSWCVYPNGPTRSGTQFGKQIAAALICAAYSFIVTFILLKLLGLLMALKPQKDDIKTSVDEHEHGEPAYHTPQKLATVTIDV